MLHKILIFFNARFLPSYHINTLAPHFAAAAQPAQPSPCKKQSPDGSRSFYCSLTSMHSSWMPTDAIFPGAGWLSVIILLSKHCHPVIFSPCSHRPTF